MFIVGITGGIGSGKSLVCSILNKFGVPVYSADAEARRLMNTDSNIRSAILQIFGERAYSGAGLNREYLAETVFGDADKLSRLNELVHPAVGDDFIRWADMQKEAPYVIEEAAILYESGAYEKMHLTVLIYAPRELRIKRVMERDQVGRKDVLKRMGHQLSEEEKMNMADHIIHNDGTQMLLPQVTELHQTILNSID
ncbi:MAG: dephospho-CoA kinase [Bacteroidales bacterium]|nr:dephospho-CoA kinase [Bacteroidales bacterium]